MPRPTLFRLRLQELHWDDPYVFSHHYEATARDLGRELNSRAVETSTVPRSTFNRWASGTWCGTPQRDARLVLERLLGYRCEQLFSPAPDGHALQSARGGSGGHALALVAERWPTSRVFSSMADTADLWELTGRNVFDGTTTAVQVHPATSQGDWISIRPADSDALRRFLRPARPGLIIGADDHDASGTRLYVIDSATVRSLTATLSDDEMAVKVPRAYELTELTYAIIWSLRQWDAGLLADDYALAEQQAALNTYLTLPRSAASPMARPALTSASVNWMGSNFCARYIRGHLTEGAAPTAFWTREQTGEQASSWLFFRHKVQYVKDMSAPRMFVVPETEVARSGCYERILLFLAVALMERHGIRVAMTARSEFSEVDGFALMSGDRAIVANWARTQSIWDVDTIRQRSYLRSCCDHLSDANGQSVMAGPDAESRLRSLADYLRLDWAWLVHHCRELGESGVSGLLQPHCRHLTLAGVDEALRFVGSRDPSL
ncbi:hypothetical protein GCM10010306_021500 [Streptomyces umbrinus]|nr:hypothetical protein GCM10010306_021500 [Streptomyces umbrinus]